MSNPTPTPSQNSNDCSKDTLRDSLQKHRLINQKLMVYEVLSSKHEIFAPLSVQANLLSKRALGVDVTALKSHSCSNLRAFSYVLIQVLAVPRGNVQTSREVAERLALLRETVPVIRNYTFMDKFRPVEMLQIFAAMQHKIADLLQAGLTVSQIIKVYSCYLDLTSFFLRALLTNINLTSAEDCFCKLPTNQIFSILSEYLDLSYIANKNIYLFPEVRYFIGSPDDSQFIFGKYYENSQELKRNQSEIRQSTLDHISKGNQKYESMKISKINLDVTMSEFMFPEKFGEGPGPLSSKAPTPEFGEGHYKGFEELLGYNSEEDSLRMEKQKTKSPKQSNQKQTKPQSLPNHNETQAEPYQQPLPQAEQSLDNRTNKQPTTGFTKKTRIQQVLTPTSNNIKNVMGIGSAFYLHQFDFYHRTNQQQKQQQQGMGIGGAGGDFVMDEKFCSERVLLKGSSMVEKGQLFLQQVGQLKKQIQSQMMDRDSRRLNPSLHQSVSIHNLGHSHQHKSRNPSPLSQNAKSQVMYDNKSNHSGFSRANTKKMGLSSEVYKINVGAYESRDRKKTISEMEYINSLQQSQSFHKQSQKNPRRSPIKIQPYSRSTSQNKIPHNPHSSPQKIPILRNSKAVKPSFTDTYHSPRIERPRIGDGYTGAMGMGMSMSMGWNGVYPNKNYNHIHIHIHNDSNVNSNSHKNVIPNNTNTNSNKNSSKNIILKQPPHNHNKNQYMPLKIQKISNKETEFHYKIQEPNNLQQVIPQIIKQIQSHGMSNSVKNQGNGGYQQQMYQPVKKLHYHDMEKFKERKELELTKSEKFISPTPKDFLMHQRYHNNNVQSEKLINEKNHQLQTHHLVKLKKRKSQDGFQTISQELYRNQRITTTTTPFFNPQVPKQQKKFMHVPSFLRGKQKYPHDDTSQNANKSIQRNHGKSTKQYRKISINAQQMHDSKRCSPKPMVISKEKDKEQPMRKRDEKSGVGNMNLNLNINVKNRVVGKCSMDLATPTFGSPGHQDKN